MVWGKTRIVDPGPSPPLHRRPRARGERGARVPSELQLPARAPPGPGWSSQPRSYRLHRGWVAAPRSTWGPGVGRGPPTSTPTRTPAGAVRSQEPGPTWSESEITLFNYTIPEPTSAIGAFELAN